MKSEVPGDEDLIKGCRENNRMCQELLYRRYARDMFNLCLIYENDRDKAKDILQESFIKIFKNIRSFDSTCKIKVWMKKIIANTAIDYFRKNLNEARFIPIESIVHPASSEESVSSGMNADDILSQVSRLPKGARMIFQLHAIEGYSHKEIARMLNISEGTSKSQISRAKQLLRQWIGGNNYRIIGQEK